MNILALQNLRRSGENCDPSQKDYPWDNIAAVWNVMKAAKYRASSLSRMFIYGRGLFPHPIRMTDILTRLQSTPVTIWRVVEERSDYVRVVLDSHHTPRLSKLHRWLEHTGLYIAVLFHSEEEYEMRRKVSHGMSLHYAYDVKIESEPIQ